MDRKLYCGLWGVGLMSLGILSGCGEPPTAPNDLDQFVVQDAGAGLVVTVVDSTKVKPPMVLPIKHD